MLHGARTYVLQDEDGQTVESHSISAGLDYPGVGPQHAHLAAIGRATYLPVTDDEAMQALALLSRTEGIIPAIESAHAIAGALRLAEERPGQTILVNLSGRGDKDMGTAIEYFGSGRHGGQQVSVSVAFEKARADGRAALVGYLPAGFPDVQGSIDALLAMVAAGCDVIEVGLPYSDPVMDGPVIQAAVQQALEAGFRVDDLFRVVEAVAATGTPTLVMTSWNPVERRGVERFAADLANAGGAGLITPDITPDVAHEWIAAADAHDLDKVFLVAPSSTDERIAMTTAACRGFVYATGIMGVTGTTQATAAGVGAPDRPHEGDHPAPRRGGCRCQHRRPGGRALGARGRRDRGYGLRPRTARRPAGPDRADRGARRGSAPCLGRSLHSRPCSASPYSLGAPAARRTTTGTAPGRPTTPTRSTRRRSPTPTGSRTPWSTTPTRTSPWSSSATRTARTSARS